MLDFFLLSFLQLLIILFHSYLRFYNTFVQEKQYVSQVVSLFVCDTPGVCESTIYGQHRESHDDILRTDFEFRE